MKVRLDLLGQYRDEHPENGRNIQPSEAHAQQAEAKHAKNIEHQIARGIDSYEATD